MYEDSGFFGPAFSFGALVVEPYLATYSAFALAACSSYTALSAGFRPLHIAPSSCTIWVLLKRGFAVLTATRFCPTKRKYAESGRFGASLFGASLLAAPLAPLKFSTSEEVMRPPGPDPVTREMSMPFSVAIALASGDATMRSPFAPPPAGAAGAAFAAAAGAAAAGAAAAGAPAAEGATTLSMSALSMTRRATGAPTGATSPSPVMIIARYPSSKASTSISALSDSTTIITSPDEILSPTFLVHCTTLPSFIVDDSAGIRIWMVGGPDATGAAAAAAAGAAAAGAAAPGAVCLPMSAWSETMTATGAPTIADSPSSTRIAER
mmetsp:Transcript_47386/g.112755  ORF Transcript_47386/g.112755 Transcript_47386/m.112755 type:complete len:323 (+) Transcript_47386:374-1342(+)